MPPSEGYGTTESGRSVIHRREQMGSDYNRPHRWQSRQPIATIFEEQGAPASLKYLDYAPIVFLSGRAAHQSPSSI